MIAIMVHYGRVSVKAILNVYILFILVLRGMKIVYRTTVYHIQYGITISLFVKSFMCKQQTCITHIR